MTDFKIGDRVRIVRTYEDGKDSYNHGLVGTLVAPSIQSRLPYRVHLDAGQRGTCEGDPWIRIIPEDYFWNAFEVEHVSTDRAEKDETVTKFNEGDRVRIIEVYKDRDHHLNGVIGTYVSYVSFDPPSNSNSFPDGFHRVTIDGNNFVWVVDSVELVSDSDTTNTTEKESYMTLSVDNVNVIEVEELKAEVERLKTLAKAYKDESERNWDAREAAVGRANAADAKYNAFRRKVAELAIETYDNGDGPWCKDGYEEAMNTLGLEEFIAKPYYITVTLTIPSTSFDFNEVRRDDLDGEEVAEILYGLDTSDLRDVITSFDTEEE